MATREWLSAAARKAVAVTCATTLASGAGLAAQSADAPGTTPRPPATASAKPARPVPRTAWDGKPDFSGVWLRATQIDRTPEGGQLNLAALDRLYRPETAALRQSLKPTDSPDYHCAPQSYPMAMSVPHPIQLVQAPGKLLVLTEYLHGFRVIPTDARTHDPAAAPSHVGDAVARWDGDTLVVDVTKFNGKQWLALSQQGASRDRPGVWPGSDAMHVTERWSLVDGDTLEYQAVIDDPKMLTAPWTSAKMHRTRLAYDVIQEDICIDDAIERELFERSNAGDKGK